MAKFSSSNSDLILFPSEETSSSLLDTIKNNSGNAKTTTTNASCPKIIRAKLYASSFNNLCDIHNSNRASNDDDDDSPNATKSQLLSTKLGLHLKRCAVHPDSIIIYHIDPSSPIHKIVTTTNSNTSTNSSLLQVGCEILSVDDFKVGQNGPDRVLDAIFDRLLLLQHKQQQQEQQSQEGYVEIVASYGERPRGSTYLLAKHTTFNDNANGDIGIPQSVEAEGGRGSTIKKENGDNSNFLNGLELEETTEGRGRVRVKKEVDVVNSNNNNSSSTSNNSKSSFGNLRFNNGDYILGIDGHPISSIQVVHSSLLRATTTAAAAAATTASTAGSGCYKMKMIPILTYNAFRRLRSTVMCTFQCNNAVMMGAKATNTTTITTKPTANTISSPKNIIDNIMKTVSLSTNNNNSDGSSNDGTKRSRESVINIEEVYQIHEKLGEGAFAVVKKATRKLTNDVVAIKIVNRCSLNQNMEKALQQEIAILKELRHDHIMRLDDVVATINHYYLVAEYLEGGELFDRIIDKSSYNESEACDVCQILFEALSYMHSRHIVHRDLKPENLLLRSKESDSDIKIADFGFAKQIIVDKHKQHDDDAYSCLKTMCGTPGYVAPEILCRRPYGTKCDMWSMGVIIFTMMCGYQPFYHENRKKLLRLCVRGEFEFDEEYWGEVSAEAKDMIRSLIEVDPRKRASAEDILSHPWMKEDREMLSRRSLTKQQEELRKYVARMRLKKAIYSILFVNAFTGENAVFSGRNKRMAVQNLENGVAELGVFC